MSGLSLPRVRREWHFDAVPVCPWCLAAMDEATVTLEQLCDAAKAGALDWPKADYAGRPDDPCAAVIECPSCGRGSMLALRSDAMALVPVRTAADVQYLDARLGEAMADHVGCRP